MKTYEVIIDGDKVTWVGDRPSDLRGVSGTLQINEPIRLTRGEDLVKVIDAIRAEGGVTCFGDALEWQRQERVDRRLPGREP